MKVLHIESGLGNQMLDYCDLLAVRKENPDEPIYIETIIYDIPEANMKISQWNGYELDRVFGIKEKNIKTLFDDDQWKRIIESVTRSEFWDDNWRYSDAIVKSFQNEGLLLNNMYSRPHQSELKPNNRLINFARTKVGYDLKRNLYRLLEQKIIGENNLFIRSSTNDYTGHTLQFCYKNRGIEKIDEEILKAFSFPDIEDPYNCDVAKRIKSTNSVAVHVRRGDMLSTNGHYYKYGYFRRAIKFIKKHVDHPVFFFFCDPASIEWVKSNLPIFALRYGFDKIEIVSGNSGLNSFRDMQLMSLCKHAVITNSSFGFWSAYLISNPKKITCSPDIRLNTTHSF